MDEEGFITDVKNISFLMVPWALITDPEYHDLSMEGKVLYAMMLDRMGLSRKNNWHDDLGRVFIYYTVEDIISNFIVHSDYLNIKPMRRRANNLFFNSVFNKSQTNDVL